MLVLITGASVGFGQAMARVFVQHGHRVIGTARRQDKLLSLQAELGEGFLPLAFDVADPEQTHTAIASLADLPEGWQDIDVLVNNAGLALGLEPAHEADLSDWQRMIDTNVVGLCQLTRLLLPQMVARKTGLIVNIGSIAGTYPYPGGNVYGATKAFVKQFSLNLRADLAGTGVRVSNIEPGLCAGTEFSNVRFKGDDDKAASVYAKVQSVLPDDIANIVYWVATQPPHVNINSLEVMPTAQSFAPLHVVRDQ